jgi:hypothetical protein
LDRALARLEALREQEPHNLYLRRLVRGGHWNRALALGELKRPAEALTDWNLAVEFASPAEWPSMQVARARCRAELGKVTDAAVEAAAVAEDPNASRGLLYNVACVYALAAAQEDCQREVYAGRALALLHRARAAGFFKERREFELLTNDADLDGLRPRDDFRAFVAELKTPEKP